MSLTIALTGASGFIGRACAATALSRGHRLRAITRAQADSQAAFPPEVETFRCDLANSSTRLSDALTGADAVIHCAAALSSDPALWRRDTIAATRNLLAAMAQRAPSARLVLLSSIAVLDADAKDITENTPTDPRPETRDGYAQSKIAQEALLHGLEIPHWVLRPGAVFGPGRAVITAHLGPQLGRALLLMGRGEQPLIDIASLAEAIVIAAETPPPETGNALNLVASDLPSPREYLAALWPHAPHPVLPFPTGALMLAARMVTPLPGLPGLLRPRILRARMGPKTYSNAGARAALGWQPAPWRDALEEALA